MSDKFKKVPEETYTKSWTSKYDGKCNLKVKVRPVRTGVRFETVVKFGKEPAKRESFIVDEKDAATRLKGFPSEGMKLVTSAQIRVRREDAPRQSDGVEESYLREVWEYLDRVR